MNMLLNGRPVDALAMIVHRSAVQKVGKEWVRKLSQWNRPDLPTLADQPEEVVPRQLFELAIQAAVGGKVYARETIPALRKDVTAGLYGGESKVPPQQIVISYTGHYERKLKHLNKQKEGKKKLKMLAGNIEVPQSAFFEVLSSRPRSFSTYTRLDAPNRPDQLDDEAYHPRPPSKPSTSFSSIVADLDGLPSKPFIHEKRRHEPLSRATQSPINRSRHLSALYKAGSVAPSTTDSNEVFSTYAQAFQSSPYGPMLSPGETMLIVKQLVRLGTQRARGVERASTESQIKEITGHLTDLVGDDATEFVEGILLRVEPRSYKWHSGWELHVAQNRVEKLMAKHVGARLEPYRDKVNYFLDMLAVTKDDHRFEEYWNRLFPGRLHPLAEDYVSRIRYYARIGSEARVAEIIQEALNAPIKRKHFLLNEAMVYYAKSGQSDTVAEIYTALTKDHTIGYPLDRPSSIFDIPDTVKANRGTYTLLLQHMTMAGHLGPSLHLLEKMYENQHVPFIPEYLSIFSGFSAFGEIAPPSGLAVDLFPKVEKFKVGRTVQSQREENVVRSNDSRSFVKIWEMGKTSLPDSTSSTGENGVKGVEKTDWTLEMFQSLFTAFIALRPDTRMVLVSTVAPNPNAVWSVLMAVSRMSGGNHVMIKQAWEAMDEKFSGKSGERWFEWRTNNRLQRVVKGLYQF